ncbi:MAG: hypothetical protein ACM3YM_12650, partial [Sphingomonadales bacterium]
MISLAMPGKPPSRRKSLRRALLLGSALGAVLLLTPQRARAAGFQGEYSMSPGTPVTINGDNSVITINNSAGSTPSAIITWSPPECDPPLGPVWTFLQTGGSADFTAGTGVTNFAVLNRIMPDDMPGQAVKIDGSVTSHIGDNIGGTVAFYTPNGLIIGPNASFDVGNLILTTANIGDSDFLGSQTPGGAHYLFTAGTTNSASHVSISPGAQISSSGKNSYVAIVSPHIDMGGKVVVDGSAGYVAAEAADVTISNGLFDIVVTTGTDDDYGANPDNGGQRNGIVHTGSTVWRGGSGSDAHRVYMVAVPKNQAITALLVGTVGFDPASQATFENGEIVLSAGYNVRSHDDGANVAQGDEIFGGSGPDGAQPASSAEANFDIIGGTFNADLIGRASNEMLASNLDVSQIFGLDGPVYQSLDFQRDVTLIGRVRAGFEAINDQTTHVGGDLIVTNGLGIGYRDPGESAGSAWMYAGPNTQLNLTVDGSATVDASVRAPLNFDAQGGEASVESDGGAIKIGQDLIVTANAVAGPAVTNDFGTSANGGTASLTVNQGGDHGGSITVTGQLEMHADATGGNASSALGGYGGSANGGQVQVYANYGDISYGTAKLSANATGGNGADAPDSEAGDGGYGGDGRSGSVYIDAYNGSITSTGTTTIHADGKGGDGKDGGAGGYGGFDIEGAVEIAAHEDYYSPKATISLGDVTVSSTGQGGHGGDASPGGTGGNGGDAGGGSVYITSDNFSASVSLGKTVVDVKATGGGGGNGGNEGDTAAGNGGHGGHATGGDVTLGITEAEDCCAPDGTISFASIIADANAFGGS